jgi:hypothetical protein
MDTQLLKQFHDQEHMRNEVHAFYKSTLDEIVVQMARSGVPTTNMEQAYKALDKAQQKLVNQFSLKTAKTTASRAY